MAGHGRGSINLQLDKLRTAGHHEHLTLRVVEKLKDQLHDAAENLHPNKIRKYQKALKEMDGDLQVVQQALHKSGEQWSRWDGGGVGLDLWPGGGFVLRLA